MITNIHLNFGYIESEAVHHLCNTLNSPKLTPESFVQRKQYDMFSCPLNILTDAEVSLEQVVKLAEVFKVKVAWDGVYLDYVW